MTQQTEWEPSENDFFVIDTNVLIEGRDNSEFSKQCTELVDSLESLSKHKNIVIPQVVEYEFLKKEKTLKQYKKTCDLFQERYIRLCTLPEVTNTAHKIQMLYKWNEPTKDHAMNNKTLLLDLIVGSTAIHWGNRMQQIVKDDDLKIETNTYILSADNDFHPPYFSVKKSYRLVSSSGYKSYYFYLFEPNKEVILQDWSTFRDQMNADIEKEEKEEAAKKKAPSYKKKSKVVQ